MIGIKWFKILKIFIADNKENISIVEYKTLQKQLDERNAERDELLFTIRVRSLLLTNLTAWDMFIYQQLMTLLIN